MTKKLPLTGIYCIKKWSLTWSHFWILRFSRVSVILKLQMIPGAKFRFSMFLILPGEILRQKRRVWISYVKIDFPPKGQWTKTWNVLTISFYVSKCVNDDSAIKIGNKNESGSSIFLPKNGGNYCFTWEAHNVFTHSNSSSWAWTKITKVIISDCRGGVKRFRGYDCDSKRISQEYDEVICANLPNILSHIKVFFHFCQKNK